MRRLPNILSIFRLTLAPVFVAVYISGATSKWVVGVYGLAMLTDALDGFIARRFHWESRFGALVDPLADKLMTTAVVSCLTYSRIIPPAALIFVAAKELIMVVCAAAIARSGIVIPAALPGKIATVLFTMALVLLLPWHNHNMLLIGGRYILAAAIAVSFSAAAYYASCVYRAGFRLRIR